MVVIDLTCYQNTIQIPLAYLPAKYFEMGATGVFIAIPVGETAITIAGFVLFKKSNWGKK